MLNNVSIVLGILVALQLLGGVLVFFGLAVSLGSLILLLHLLPVTFLFHPFWYLQGADQAKELVLFMKNCIAIGGILALMVVRSNQPRRGYKVVKEGNYADDE